MRLYYREEKIEKNWLKMVSERQLRLYYREEENIEKIIKNGLKTTFEIILQWREDWKNDQKWFENDNWDCGQNQNPLPWW